jgi:hypothetical protein
MLLMTKKVGRISFSKVAYNVLQIGAVHNLKLKQYDKRRN